MSSKEAILTTKIEFIWIKYPDKNSLFIVFWYKFKEFEAKNIAENSCNEKLEILGIESIKMMQK